MGIKKNHNLARLSVSSMRIAHGRWEDGRPAIPRTTRTSAATLRCHSRSGCALGAARRPAGRPMRVRGRAARVRVTKAAAQVPSWSAGRSSSLAPTRCSREATGGSTTTSSCYLLPLAGSLPSPAPYVRTMRDIAQTHWRVTRGCETRRQIANLSAALDPPGAASNGTPQERNCGLRK